MPLYPHAGHQGVKSDCQKCGYCQAKIHVASSSKLPACKHADLGGLPEADFSNMRSWRWPDPHQESGSIFTYADDRSMHFTSFLAHAGPFSSANVGRPNGAVPVAPFGKHKRLQLCIDNTCQFCASSSTRTGDFRESRRHYTREAAVLSLITFK